MRVVGAVDIGGTKIAVGIVREDGVVLADAELATAPERGFNEAAHRVRDLLRQLSAASGALAGIGIACPGPLDPFTGILGNVGTLPGWEGGNLVEAIAAPMGLSAAVENDADAAALAEAHWGRTRTSGTLIYVTVSTGIGAGVVHNGSLYRGTRGAHPELGHQVIDPSGPLCYCGLQGCWESLASGTAMSAFYQHAAPEIALLSAGEICRRARQGESLALQAVERERRYLALGLANLVTMFAPDVVTLGGGVMKSSDLFLDYVTRFVQTACTQVPVEHTHIALTSLGAHIGLLGAARAWLLRNP